MLCEILSTFTLIILFITIAIECWKVYLNNTKFKAFYHVKGWPVIGKGLDLSRKDNVEFFKPFCTETGRISYAWVGPVCLFHISHPEDFQAVLTSHKCLKKAIPYSFLHNDTGLLTSEPEIWKEHRRILNPTLGAKMVTSFLPILNVKLRKMVDLIEPKVGNNIDIYQIMFKASLESVTCSTFGVDYTLQNKRGDEFCYLLEQVIEHIQNRFQRIWFWNPIYKLTNEYKIETERISRLYRLAECVVETKKMQLAEKLEYGDDELATAKEKNNQNLLQKCLQMELEHKWSDENVCDEIKTVLIAGVDTTSTILNGISLMLAIHQEYQKRVVNEMCEIFDNVNEPVTNEHLLRMTFLELVIKESLRLIPVGAIGGRECTSDFTINGGVIPKGSQIAINIFATNRSSRFYGANAHEFYPERFLPENCSNWHPYLFIPFSHGPRNCMGSRYAWTSLKIALSYLLRRFKLTTHLRMQDLIIKPDLLTKIGNKNAIRIERREWKLKSQNHADNKLNLNGF